MFVGIKVDKMMMKPVSGNADKVLNFLNTGHENIELTIEKRYQKLPVLDVLTPQQIIKE